jgi:hypothetical protein
MQVSVHPGLVLTSGQIGTDNGIHQTLTTYFGIDGHTYMTFPFTIDGM